MSGGRQLAGRRPTGTRSPGPGWCPGYGPACWWCWTGPSVWTRSCWTWRPPVSFGAG